MAPLIAAIIMTNTSSYSSTGGNVVGPGGTVVTGAQQSSAYSENTDNSTNDSYSESEVNISDQSGSGGSATVQVKTDNNGQVSQQTITKPIPAGGSVDIDIATSTGGSIDSHVTSSFNASVSSGGLSSLSHAIHHLLKIASTSASSSLEATATVNVAQSGPVFGEIDFGDQIKAFFSHLFSVLGFNW